MIEPIVNDFIRLALELDRDTFCQKLEVPVLVSATPRPGQSFQSAKTRVMAEGEQSELSKRLARLDHRSAVLELRRLGPSKSNVIAVGRSEENDIVFDEEEISAQHAVFQQDRRTGRFLLQDLESTNGTTVNQTALLPGRAVELQDGDILRFGSLAFLFFYPGGFFDAITLGG